MNHEKFVHRTRPSIVEIVFNSKTFGTLLTSSTPRVEMRFDEYRASIARRRGIHSVVSLGEGRPGLIVLKSPVEAQ